jgi:phosphatidylglycerophosphate synthase
VKDNPASTLTMAELRAIAQPPSTMNRHNAEHWAGPLYLRKGSIYLTRYLFLPSGMTPNAVTWLMVFIGACGAGVLVWPSWWALLICAVLMQFQIMVDCSDGEVARTRKLYSPAGVYIDRIGHYSSEALLAIGLGVHVDGGLGSIDGWTTVGALTAVAILMNKSFTDLVHVARAAAGLPKLADTESETVMRVGLLAKLRGGLNTFPIFRIFISIEFSLLILLLGSIDALVHHAHVLRGFVLIMLPLAVVLAGGHLLAVLLSSRLRRPPDES